MIVKVNHPAGDHYHICDSCGLESAPDECIDPADECVDIECAECEQEINNDMGYYIETDLPTGKADQLVATGFAGKISQPKDFSEVPEGQALLCVVANPLFEAAAFVYNQEEWDEFTRTDDLRPKNWLLMAWNVACEMSGFNNTR